MPKSWWRVLTGSLMVLLFAPHGGFAAVSRPTVMISAVLGDRLAAETLREVLTSLGRPSAVQIVENTGSNFDAVKAVKLAYLRGQNSSVAILRWTRRERIPLEYFSGFSRIVMLGPTEPIKIHIVSWRRSKLIVSADTAGKKSFEHKVFGLGLGGTPTEEDAQNLFKALDTYPCPHDSKCEELNSDEEMQQFLSGRMDAFFLSADCPDAKVQFAQDRLGQDFYLVPVPTLVTQEMQSLSDKPYVPTLIDPNQCTYSKIQGTIQTTGVSRSVVAPSGVDPQIARDVAVALVEKPPFSKDSFRSVLPKLNQMFPFAKETTDVYRQWF